MNTCKTELKVAHIILTNINVLILRKKVRRTQHAHLRIKNA